MCTKVPLELQLSKDENESITMEYTNSHREKIDKEVSLIKRRFCGLGLNDLTLTKLPGKKSLTVYEEHWISLCSPIGITRASNGPEMADVEYEINSTVEKYAKPKSELIVYAL